MYHILLSVHHPAYSYGTMVLGSMVQPLPGAYEGLTSVSWGARGRWTAIAGRLCHRRARQTNRRRRGCCRQRLQTTEVSSCHSAGEGHAQGVSGQTNHAPTLQGCCSAPMGKLRGMQMSCRSASDVLAKSRVWQAIPETRHLGSMASTTTCPASHHTSASIAQDTHQQVLSMASMRSYVLIYHFPIPTKP